MRFATLLLSMLVLASVTACGKVSLNIGDLTGNPSSPTLRLSKGAEFVAAAQQGERTLNGYTVDSATGSIFSKLESTTPNGYKVYSTVQGHLISEEKQKAAAAAAVR